MASFCRLLCATITAINFIVMPIISWADDPRIVLENILQARYQYTNFDASIVVEQTKEPLWQMPSRMQYDIRMDEANGRYWLHRRPLVEVVIPNDDLQLRARQSWWLESYAMYRDSKWSYGVDGELGFSMKPSYESRLSYTVFTLGFCIRPISDWTSSAINRNRGVFGLKVPSNKFSFKSESRIIDGVTLEGIDCTHDDGLTRTFWVDRNSLRLHRIEIPYGYMLKDGEVGQTTIDSAYSPGNDTVIPNHVVIRETVDKVEKRVVSIELVRFERDMNFTDDDFAYTNMGIKINRFVRDLDTGILLGYWNGRDWSSKEPIIGGAIVNAAIDENNKMPRSTSVLRTFAILSTALAGILLSVWIWRRFRSTN